MSALQNALNARLQSLRTWFAGLSARDRRIVVWGGSGAAVLLFVAAGVLPLYAATSKAYERVEQKREDLNWMRSVAGELHSAGPASAGGQSSGSLIVVIDESARQTGLGAALTGSQPSGNGGLRVRVESASFDTLVGWLALLEQQHGITVESASVDRTSKSGHVNASVVLRKSG
jgi:general secretion pathway protein M